MTDAFHNLYNYKFTLIDVIDGDTVKGLAHLGMGVTLDQQNFRLYGIDTPEKRGYQKPFGDLVTERLKEKFKSKRNELEERAKKSGLKGKKLKEAIEESTQLYIRTHKDKRGKYGRFLIEIHASDMFSFNKWLLNRNYAVDYHGKSKAAITKEHAENRKIVMG